MYPAILPKRFPDWFIYLASDSNVLHRGIIPLVLPPVDLINELFERISDKLIPIPPAHLEIIIIDLKLSPICSKLSGHWRR